MPLPQLDADQQKELDAIIASKSEEFHKGKLAELGYDDHASKILEKTRKEAQTNRERAEKLEKDLKAAADAEVKRKADEDAENQRIADEKKKREDDEKPIKERLDAMQKNFADDLAKRDKAAATKDRQFAEQLKKRDEALVRKSVISALKEKGAIDAELIALAIDLSVVTVEDGEVNEEELAALIDAVAEQRKHLFKEKDDEQVHDERRSFVRPKPGGKKGEVDASKLGDAEFDALEAGLRSGRT